MHVKTVEKVALVQLDVLQTCYNTYAIELKVKCSLGSVSDVMHDTYTNTNSI